VTQFLARKYGAAAWLVLLLGNRAQPAAASDKAAALRVALGENKPPYIFQQEQRGVEVDLVLSLLQDAGYAVQLLYLPNRRAQRMLAIGMLDAAISAEGDYLSAPYIAYQNVAVTLCSAHIVLNSVADLAGRRIAAFHNAHLYLGPEFMAVAAGNPDYREPPQDSINRLLYARGIEVGISDINVFRNINERLGLDAQAAGPWCPHRLFAPTQYRLAFRNRDARDRFDRALRQALKGQRYEALARRYRLPLNNGHPYFKPTSHVRGHG